LKGSTQTQSNSVDHLLIIRCGSGRSSRQSSVSKVDEVDLLPRKNILASLTRDISRPELPPRLRHGSVPIAIQRLQSQDQLNHSFNGYSLDSAYKVNGDCYASSLSSIERNRTILKSDADLSKKEADVSRSFVRGSSELYPKLRMPLNRSSSVYTSQERRSVTSATSLNRSITEFNLALSPQPPMRPADKPLKLPPPIALKPAINLGVLSSVKNYDSSTTNQQPYTGPQLPPRPKLKSDLSPSKNQRNTKYSNQKAPFMHFQIPPKQFIKCAYLHGNLLSVLTPDSFTTTDIYTQKVVRVPIAYQKATTMALINDQTWIGLDSGELFIPDTSQRKLLHSTPIIKIIPCNDQVWSLDANSLKVWSIDLESVSTTRVARHSAGVRVNSCYWALVYHNHEVNVRWTSQ